MPEPTWEFYARQLLGVLASAASVFLFLALLAFEWQRMEALRACREVASQIKARNEAIRAEREKRREERRRLAGVPPRGMVGAIRKMMKS